MRDSEELISQISEIVADVCNDPSLERCLSQKLENAFSPYSLSLEDKEKILEDASVISCDVHAPGCLPDEEVRFFPPDTDFKEIILEELDICINGLEPDDANLPKWGQMEDDISNCDEGYLSGDLVLIFPNGNVFSMERHSCAKILSLREISYELSAETGAKLK